MGVGGGVMTTLAEVLAAVDRDLTDDEIRVAGRLIEAGRTLEEIQKYLDERTPVPTDDELETYRYEAQGSSVVPIPDKG